MGLIMQGLAEVKFYSKSHGSAAVAGAINEFVQTHSDWKLLEQESARYAESISKFALIAESTKTGQAFGSAVAIAEEHEKVGIFRIFNVVPRQGELTTKEYNTTAREFVMGFRRFCRRRLLGISARIELPRTPTKLEEIIPGAKTGRLFEGFLIPGSIWGTSNITHPLDIERLDRFICAIHRFRARINLVALEYWLITEKGWPQEDARWTSDRIAIGLKVLAANRAF